jgi:hypothetical protein
MKAFDGDRNAAAYLAYRVLKEARSAYKNYARADEAKAFRAMRLHLP